MVVEVAAEGLGAARGGILEGPSGPCRIHIFVRNLGGFQYASSRSTFS